MTVVSLEEKKKKFWEGDGSRGREKNLGKGTARTKKTIARVLKSEIRVLKLLNNFYKSQVSKYRPFGQNTFSTPLSY